MDTVYEQHISSAEFWRVVGKSGVDGGWMEIVRDGESFGKWFSLTYKGPNCVSLRCFLGSEIDTAIWFHRPNRCLIVAYVHERTHDSSVLLKFSLICSFYSFL